MGSDSTQLFHRSLARRAERQSLTIPCSDFVPPISVSVQTEATMRFERGSASPRPAPSTGSNSEKTMLVASELLRLPSVDDLTCDAGDDTATIEQNIDDADSLNYTALNDLTRRGAAQDDVDTVVDGKIVWTQQMAQVQFGVVPVVELADFINL